LRGILFSQMQPPEEWDAEFHDWYNAEHIPARLALPGFDAAIRYRVVEGEPKYLAVYEMSDMSVLKTPEYQRLKDDPSELTKWMLDNVSGFTRYTCEEQSDTGPHGSGDYLFVVAFSVPESDEPDFDDWYENEHIDLLMKADDWLRVRRYKVISGEGGDWTHLALHELASLEVMSSAEREAARKGPKRDALADRPWFGKSGRWLYQTIHRA
jgi:hypothetical protein